MRFPTIWYVRPAKAHKNRRVQRHSKHKTDKKPIKDPQKKYRLLSKFYNLSGLKILEEKKKKTERYGFVQKVIQIISYGHWTQGPVKILLVTFTTNVSDMVF